MGLSKNNRYSLTEHAKARYRERINSNISELEMKKDFRCLMQESRFLSKENNKRESWIHDKRGIVLIVDPTKYLVITLYSTLDEYEKQPKSEEKEANHLHPKVKNILSEFAKKSLQTEERNYLSALAPWYKEYAERMDKLSRTTKQDTFAQKKDEMDRLRYAIEKLERERDEVLNGLGSLVKEETNA